MIDDKPQDDDRIAGGICWVDNAAQSSSGLCSHDAKLDLRFDCSEH